MDIEKLFESAENELKEELYGEIVSAVKHLIVKRNKAQLVLDNINREIEDKKVEITHKINSTGLGELPGFSGESD